MGGLSGERRNRQKHSSEGDKHGEEVGENSAYKNDFAVISKEGSVRHRERGILNLHCGSKSEEAYPHGPRSEQESSIRRFERDEVQESRIEMNGGPTSVIRLHGDRTCRSVKALAEDGKLLVSY